MKRNQVFILTASVLLLSACSGGFLKLKKDQEINPNNEFENRVKIVETPTFNPKKPEPEVQPQPTPLKKRDKVGRQKEAEKKVKEAIRVKESARPGTPVPAIPVKEPSLESSEGFLGRRPFSDPFRVGEKLTFNVHYFKMDAATMVLEVLPFVSVNGVKSYQFGMSIKSKSFFNSVYSIDDKVTTYVDYEKMIPFVFNLNVKETSQIKEAQSYFDWQKNEAQYWEQKITDKYGKEEKKKNWEILPYSQNVYSSVFYLRAFKWDVGVENQFRVSNDGDNLIFKGKAIRKEKIDTAVGEKECLVIKLEFMLKGKFEPSGDNYIWITNDDRKMIVRLESKIKIGTLVGEITDIQPGQ